LHSEFDVIIVGAGPAGSLAALRLARAGLRVRLIDRAVFPRHKLCGDTLNPGSLAILDGVGGPDRLRQGYGEARQSAEGATAAGPRPHPAREVRRGRPASRPASLGAQVRARGLRTTGMTVTGPGRVSVSADYPQGLAGVALSRRDLDLLLVEAAVQAGAHFEPAVSAQEPLVAADGARVTGVRVTCRGATHSFHSRIVIAADGRGSRLASALKLARFASSPRRWAYGAYFGGVAGLSSRGEMHIRADGYVGVAPLPGEVANICVVRAATGSHASPAQVIANAIAADPALRDRCAGASRLGDVLVLGPLAVESLGAGCQGLLLAGDAAGFVDPMTGDGMRFALRGGELAAEAAIRELDSGVPSFAALAASRAREFAGKWRINRALRSLVGSPRGLEAAALVARFWAAPVEYLIGVAGDVSLARPPA
jgi:flavin-dependent dehydrogenase